MKSKTGSSGYLTSEGASGDGMVADDTPRRF